MKKDGEIKLLLEERNEGVSQKLAAARTGIYFRLRRLPPFFFWSPGSSST